MNKTKENFQEVLFTRLQQHGTKTAVQYGEKEITYDHLRRYAIAITNGLLERKISNETFIGIYIQDRIDLICSIVGITAAGSVFMPMDPTLPETRIREMLEITGTQYIITSSHLREKLETLIEKSGQACRILVLEDLYEMDMPELPPVTYSREDKLYVYFTSGSTGKPKGIVGKNKSLLQYIQWEVETFDIRAGFRFSQLAGIGFDAFLKDLFVPLFAGGTLCIPPQRDIITDGPALSRWLDYNRIDVVQCVPSIFRLFNTGSLTADHFENLKYILLAGEPLNPGELTQWYKTFGERVQLVNLYGPTETTILKTYYFINPADAQKERIPIGKPTKGARLIILDDNMKVCDKGMKGEIYIRTPFLTVGYCNDSQMTAQRFIVNPFNNDPNDLIYRTGDLGLLLPDGNYEWLGRIDRQVKIRGVRIELEEIEHRIAAHETVREAAVTTITEAEGDVNLCAYIVFSDGGKEELDTLKEYIFNRLPVYMIPNYFIPLETFPRLPNGKINRRALPAPSEQITESHVAPRDDIEKKLADIWMDVLRKGNGNNGKPVGIDDNFFKSGGHSIKGTLLLSKVHQAFSVRVTLAQFFINPTIRGLADCLKAADRESLEFHQLTSMEKKDYYPLSSAQRRLFVMHNMDKTGTGYNMWTAVTLEGETDAAKLETAFQKVIHRHESLRTSFEMVGDDPVQRVRENVDFHIQHLKPSSSNNAPETLISRFIRPCDLTRAPLIRVGLVQTGPDVHLLIMDIHHIVSDGTSMGLVFQDLMDFYNGKEKPEPKIQYKDFAQWQNRFRRDAAASWAKQEAFWLAHFQGEIPLLNLPLDFPRPVLHSFEGRSYRFRVSMKYTAALNQLAEKNGATLYMVLLAIYNLLLSRLSGADDIVVGSPASGRRHVDLMDITGMFVNTLPLRNFPKRNKTVTAFLQEVKTRTLQAFENQDYQYDDLVEAIGEKIARDTGRNPLFDVMLVLQNFDVPGISIPGLTLKPFQYESRRSRFDMTLIIVETDGELDITVEYGTHLFRRETIQRFAGYFNHLVAMIPQEPEKLVSQVDIIPPEEKETLLSRFNDTAMDFPTGKTLHQLLEEQAEKSPDAIAVVDENIMDSSQNQHPVTYRRLDETSNGLASLIRVKGVEPGSIVALLLERSIEMVTAMIAVLKAGCTYLPIDPQYPRERIHYMLADSQASLILSTTQLMDGVGAGTEIINMDTVGDIATAERMPETGDSSVPAYVIYTSGSTGKPKGVVVGHRGFINLIDFHYRVFREGPGDRMSQVAGPGFDAMAFEVWPCLAAGASLYIIPNDVRMDPRKLKHWLIHNKITISFQSTLMGEQLLQEEWPETGVALRALRVAGDRLNRFPTRTYPFTFYNLYGPTEDTVWTTWTEVPISQVQADGAAVSVGPHIGKPIANHRVYILGPHLQLQPIGVPGELCIAGEGLAIGYLNNPQRTAERFIHMSHPSYPSHLSRQSHRIYRTGDQARWTANGCLEFLGRTDHQVKIRGFRIEPGEIETRLLEHPLVNEAAVIPNTGPDMNKYLCAYIVPDRAGDVTILPDTLKAHLAETLPDYMIPAHMAFLDAMPLTPSGKLDRQALPQMETTVSVRKGETIAPTNLMEETLVDIWQQVLGVEPIGIDDNFFQMGGDSIKAIQVSNRLLKTGLKLDVARIFSAPTIRRLGKEIQTAKQDIFRESEPVSGDVPLTPIMKWFFQSQFSHPHHFNQSVMITHDGGFGEELLQTVFTKLVEHHDALRMKRMTSDQTGITIRPFETDTDVPFFKLETRWVDGSEAMTAEAERVQRSMDPVSGLNVQSVLFKGNGGNTDNTGDSLLIVIHHLVVDGVSWRILLEDFSSAYMQAQQGEPISLQPKTDSYNKYSHQLTKYATGKQALKELSYWRGVERVASDIEDFPTDYPVEDSKRTIKHMDTRSFSLSQIETETLSTHANRAFNTGINDILLAALAAAFKQWRRLDRVLINLEGHGRESIIDGIDISRTVGWFTSQYPVLLEAGQGTDRLYILKSVKETLRRIPNKGTGYGILKYLTPPEQLTDVAFTAQPAVNFNYLGQFAETGLSSTSSFEYSRDHTGTNVSLESEQRFTLDIGGMMTGGRLHLHVSYNKHEYKNETIDRLMDCFKTNLLTLIHQCAAKTEPELTPSDLGMPQLSLDDWQRVRETVETERTIQSIYPLSPMQTGMLFHALENPDSNAYFEQSTLTLNGPLDNSLFQQGIRRLVQRHDVLRTVFLYDALDEPLQIVLDPGSFSVDIRRHDLSHLSGDETALDRYLESYKQKDRQEGFQLSRSPLMRIALFTTGENSSRLVWSFHHILMDGWCLSILFNDLLKIYRNLRDGGPLALTPETPVPYRDYIRWLGNRDKEESADYWQRYLDGYAAAAVVPRTEERSDQSRPQYQPDTYPLELDVALSSRLRQIAGQHNVTLNTLFQVVWGILLQRYNNSGDVVFGAVTSGRPAEIDGIEHMVGLFINTVPVRVRTSEGDVFSRLLTHLQTRQLASQQYDYLSPSEIQGQSVLGRHLIDNLLVFESFPVNHKIKRSASLTDNLFRVVRMENREQTNYDFNIVIIPGETLTVKFLFNATAYPTHFIRQCAGHWREILHQAADNPEIPIADIDILTEKEKETIIFHFNRTQTNYPKDKTIHRLFAEQVSKTPDNTAVVVTDAENGVISVTYRQLNRIVNHFALLLQEKGAGFETIVAVKTGRSLAMIVSILAVLKTGGTYMPIDPKYPQKRIRYMMLDAGAALLMTNQTTGTDIFPDPAPEIIDLPTDAALARTACNLSGDGDADPGDSAVAPGSTAYIMYTSGSTGKPKGVMVTHRNVIRLVKEPDFVTFADHDRILQTGAPVFDAATFEIWGSLLNGLQLHIVPDDVILDAAKLGKALTENRITILWLSSPLFNQLCFQDETLFSPLRYLLVGGDVLSPTMINRVRQANPRLQVINGYGPTENTTFSTTFPIQTDYHSPIPIGRPIADSTAYILSYRGSEDRGGASPLSPVPVGIYGELYVGGHGVARGYLNNPQLTHDKFIPNPWVPGDRLYRTGDLARWLPDGTIAFLGRRDRQVKIRGFRVETGEIENQLRRYDPIDDAVVTVIDSHNGDKSLCAYFTHRQPVPVDRLRNHLAGILPDYMIPAYFIPVETIPLTINGKVDLKKLPHPTENLQRSGQYVPPATLTEQRMAGVWQEVLGIKTIGISDHFFQLGGDSIKAIQVVSRLMKYGLKLEIKDLFAHPTIKETAALTRSTENSRTAQQGIIEGYVPLTPIQQWFFESIRLGIPSQRNHFNQSVMLYSETGFSEAIIRPLFEKMVQHHDALRMVYRFDGDNIIQYNRGEVEPLFHLEVTDLTDVDAHDDIAAHIKTEAEVFQRSIDLETGPLVKLGLFKTNRGDHLLMIIHHLVVDGVSWRILLEDFSLGYQQLERGETIAFQEKTDSFLRWGLELEKYAASETTAQERDYWRSVEAVPVPTIPRDFTPQEPPVNADTQSVTVALSPEETQCLLRDVNRAYSTEINDILLTALAGAFNRWCGVEQIKIHLEGHGREEILRDLDIGRTVGWFTSLFPVVLDISASTEPGYRVKAVKETLRKIPAKGIGYGILKYLSTGVPLEEISGFAGADIGFNYLGQFEPDQTDHRFGLSSLNAGAMTDPGAHITHAFNINALITEKRLSTTFNYSRSQYREQSVQALADHFREYLLELIVHCSGKDEQELTPGDMDYANDLSIETLDQLEADFEDLDFD